jgi:hypothetical protein
VLSIEIFDRYMDDLFRKLMRVYQFY